MQEVRVQLAIVFGMQLVVNNTIEFMVPYVQAWQKRRLRKADKSLSSVAPPVLSAAEREATLGHYEGALSEYDELVMQFGFVTFFVTAFPVAPMLALINNMIEQQVDSTKLLSFYRRPDPKPVRSIGVWYTLLTIQSYIAVITNCAVVIFNSSITADYTVAQQLMLFIAAEHVFLGLKIALDYMMGSMSKSVKLHLARQTHVGNVLIVGGLDVNASHLDHILRDENDLNKKNPALI